MATRKSRQNTESPTPSGTESVPSTPTTPATRNTRSIRNKQLQMGKIEETPSLTSTSSIRIKAQKADDEEEAVKDTINDEEVSKTTAETPTTAAATADSPTTESETPTPTAATVKPETKSDATEQNDVEKEKETSPPAASTRKRRILIKAEKGDDEEETTTVDKPTETVKAETVKTESPNTPTADGKTSPTKIKRSRRSAFELLTDDHPDLLPNILNTRRNSTGKMEKPTRKLSSRIKKLKQRRKTPLRAMLRRPPERIPISAVNKPIKQLIEKQAAKNAKAEKSDSASDSELTKMSRRRSDSVSKCSDITDASSFQETKDSNEDLVTQSTESIDTKTVVVKEESSEKDETAENKPSTENVTDEAVRGNANDSGIAGDSDNSQAAKPDSETSSNDGNKRASRFSLRKRQLNPTNPPRVMNTRSRSETPSKAASETQDDDDDGSTVSTKEVKKEKTENALQIDTTVNETTAVDEKPSPELEQSDKEKTDVDGGDDEKAKSLSPVLVSEGVSEISVKQFYGRADFLENNLGIEKDPKLGEIVQIQEKIKADSDKLDEEPSKQPKQSQKDCTITKPSEELKKPDANEDTNELDTSTESMETDADQMDVKIDGANCDDRNAKDAVDCFIKPTEIVRRDSATILNENLLVLNGEIELTSKKEKKEVTRNVEEDVGEVVLYKISNGMRVNPEKLEKVLESQKLKEKERSSSIESGGSGGDGQSSGEDNENKDKNDKKETATTSIKMVKDDENTGKYKTKTEEPKQSNSTESKVVIDVDASAETTIKPAAVRSSSSSKDSRSSSLDDESPEEKIQKESHLKTLGLLTHQAAEEATIEKQKQREKIKASKGKKNAEYTGTLKTVIKLHRGNDKKKGNQSLKMTLHKGRVKNGSDKSDSHSTANSEEDTYYTIQQQDMDSFDHEADEAAAKEHEKLLVIPEKASSFRYHPEKLCEDQCFYCGGKFGLFDTPCHIAQIKSAERQKKILEYEEKLTVDSCLCDACFRHVDRRANCPSYKKRLSEPPKTQNDSNAATDESEDKETENLFQQNREVTFCHVHDCKEQASHSMCRKWALKVRKTLNKHIHLNLDNTTTLAFLPICDKHYEDINHMLICMLCNRRLKRNHCYFLSQDAHRVESLIANEGINVNVGNTSVACKLCRYYVNMLMRPQEAKKVEFLRDYRKRILEYHGKVDLVEDDSEDSTTNHESSTKRPKRNRKSLNDQQQSDDISSKIFKSSKSSDVSMEMGQDLAGTSTRTRQKNKQMNQQQLLEEQKRVEKRVQQEQLKLKQQELLQQQQQQQKLQDEIRQQQLRSSNEDISNLRTNPNISMRELFPGEEEMGLNINIPFGNSWRTPDGWQKVTTTIQYDEPTRKLWEELQKPYGNQSSFIRHLLLLEKYFRNGDLLLVQNANHNAITYCESVQHRLQAFDNIPPRAVSISQILSQNSTTQSTAMDLASSNTKSITTANKAVTISKVSAQPSPLQTSALKQPPPALSITANPKPSTNDSPSTSLLKSSVAQIPRSKSYTVTTEPINPLDKIDLTKATNSITNSVGASTSTNASANIAAATPKSKNPGLPPELICIATSSNDKHSNQPPPSYQMQMQLTLQQQIQQQHQNSLRLPKQMLQNIMPTTMAPAASAATNQITSPKKQATPLAQHTSTSANKSPTNSSQSSSSPASNVIRLPEALTEAERRDSKNWRPTLMPITAEKNNTDGKLYQTADGRRLPYLVQVQSGGKPYMISIHDYNRMCILRRERLLKDQTELMKNKSNQNSNSSPTVPTSTVQKQPAIVPPLTTASSIVNNLNAKTTAAMDADKVTKQHANASSSNNGQVANKVQVPNKILEQNSLIPINSSSSSSNSSSSSSSKPNENSSDSLLRFRFSKSNKSSLLKSNASHHAKPSMPPQLIPSSVAATAIASNPLAKLPIPLSNVLSQSNVVSITSTPSISAMLGMTQAATPPPPIQMIPNPTPPITITNVSSGSTIVNQSSVSSLEALFRTTNQVTTTPTTMWQWAEQLNKSNSITPVDNSASSILSKIPKSLTVIPQQKNKGIDE